MSGYYSPATDEPALSALSSSARPPVEFLPGIGISHTSCADISSAGCGIGKCLDERHEERGEEMDGKEGNDV